MTLNQIITQIQSIADNHKQIHSFGFGDVWDIATSGDIYYPMCYATLENSQIANKTETLNFRFIFMDIVKGGRVNEQEVLSDQLEIAKDILSQLYSTDYDWMVDDTSVVTIEDFTERFTDSVAGVTFSIALNLPFAFDRCAIPMTDAPTYITSSPSLSTIPSYQTFKQINITSGNVDGVNSTFVCAYVPVQVYHNGQLLVLNTDYTLSSYTITLLITTYAGDTIIPYGTY